MPNKKSLGCFTYAFFSVSIFALIIVLCVLPRQGVLEPIWAATLSFVLFITWAFVSAKISKKQIAEAPILQSNAVLTDKIQESNRGRPNYFLFFTLDDGSKKSFYVERDVYASFSKDEKGLLKYKHVNPKIDNYLSYRFVDFETQ